VPRRRCSNAFLLGFAKSWKKKNPPPFCFGSGFGIVFALVLALVSQRLQHDRQPATGVVVMPITMMAVIGAKHCSGLIPEPPAGCQTLLDKIYRTDRIFF
jgi:hypothetical protein